MPAKPPWFESRLYQQGYNSIAGVDEVGRGCLAGPVFAAAVIFPPGDFIAGVKDSKELSPKKREELADEIRKRSLAWAVASVPAEEVDRLNIHRASLLVMRQAVCQLAPSPQYVLVDGRFRLDIPLSQEAVVKGDQRCFSVAAASILAKVSRDRWMVEQSSSYPHFFFEKHKGYGTRQHREAINQYGLTPLHRRSFRLTSYL